MALKNKQKNNNSCSHWNWVNQRLYESSLIIVVMQWLKMWRSLGISQLLGSMKIPGNGAIMSLNKSLRFCTEHSSPQSCLCQRLMFTTFTKPNPKLTYNHVIISLAFQHLECYLPLNQGFRPVWHHQCFGKTNLHIHSYAGSKYPERPTSNFHIWNRPL